MIGLYKQHKKIFLTFIILAFVLYGNTLKNKYALDDDYVTVTNFPVKGKNYAPNNELAAKGFGALGKIWKVRYAHDGESSFDYRPITSVSFALEYGLFGQNPFVSHLVNVLLYALTICILFCVLLLLFESYENKLLLATLTAFIFLILPVHTEVVNNLKCRDEIMSFMFPLIAFWYCLKAYDKPSVKHILLILFFFVLGIYSKRTATIFIGIIPLAFICFRKVNVKHLVSALVLVLSSIAISSLIKRQLITEPIVRKFYSFENAMLTEHASLLERLFATLKTIGFYIKFALVPFPFRSYYGTNVIDITPKPDLNMLVAIAFFIGSAWYYFKTKNKLFLFGFLLYMGGIFPFANLMIPVAGVVGERLVYNASFGIAVMIAALIAPLFKSVSDFSFNGLLKKPVVYFMPVIAAYTLMIWARNTNWKDKLTLFEHDIPYLEASAKANSMLGNEYFELIRDENFKKYPAPVLIQKALNNYQTAVKNDSSFYSAYNNAGVLYFSYIQDPVKAEQYFKLGIKSRPIYPQAYENLGNLYRHLNRKEEALQAYVTALKQNPKQYNAYISSIKLCYEAKEYGKAMAFARVASMYFPNDYTFIGQEADCLFMLGQIKPALSKYEEAYNLSNNASLATYLAVKYLETGDTAKSNFYKNKQQ
jgi:hypothetical protein